MRIRTVLLLFSMLLLVIGALFGQDLYRVATTRVEFSIVGRGSGTPWKVIEQPVHRWRQGPDGAPLRVGERRTWDVLTGFLSGIEFVDADGVRNVTLYDSEGRVAKQIRSRPGTGTSIVRTHRSVSGLTVPNVRRGSPQGVVRSEPPWLWGATDQAEPTAPWVSAGEPFSVWGAELLKEPVDGSR